MITFLRDIPLSLIRHNDLPCYVKEGYGAKPIEMWPVYNFFSLYQHGEKEQAIQNFVTWYDEQLLKYSHTPKSEGGMCKGSLYTLIENYCNVPFEEVDPLCKTKAIRERVMQRFHLFEVIQQEGYRPERAERILAFKKNGCVYLEGGHHRAAILRVLGKDTLPSVLVFPNQFIYNLVRFLRNIKHGNFHK
jgi:hypothetical protein